MTKAWKSLEDKWDTLYLREEVVSSWYRQVEKDKIGKITIYSEKIHFWMRNDRETTLQIPFSSQVYLTFSVFWPFIFPSNSNAYHISCNEIPTFNFVFLQWKLLIRNLIVGEFWNRKLILAYVAAKSTGKQIKGNKGF